MGIARISSWCLAMADLPRMNDEQRKQARKLIRSRCCNYDNGSCLLFDWPFCNVCPQWISYSLNCKWFRNAVLPNDPELESKILGLHPKRCCTICNAPIYAKSNRAKYCPECARKERRRKEAIRLHNHYLKSRI